MIAPIQTAPRAEVLLHPRLGLHHGGDDLECAADETGTGFIGQCEGLLRRKRVFFRGGIVVHISPGGLIVQPLANIPLMRAGLFCQFRRSRRAIGRQRFIKPKPIADQHERRAHPRADIPHGFSHEFLKFVRIDAGGHGDLL